jgi:hypothetical protein
MASRNHQQISTTYGSDIVVFAGNFQTDVNGEVTTVTPANGYTFDVTFDNGPPSPIYFITATCAFDASWEVENILFFNAVVETSGVEFFEWSSLPSGGNRLFRMGVVSGGSPVAPSNKTIHLMFAVKYTTSVR